MTAHRPFGRRTPGVRATAQTLSWDTAPRSQARLARSFSETEDFARGLVTRQQETRTRSRRGLWIGAVAVVAAVGFSLPYFGVGDSGLAPMTVAELDALTPEQLAELSPAAGGQQSTLASVVDRLFGFGALKN